MTDLHLNLTRAEFDAVKSGEKKLICHPTGRLWNRILEGREFSRVLFKHAGEVFACSWFGYEMRIDVLRTEIRRGVSDFTPTRCFAIRVGVAL